MRSRVPRELEGSHFVRDRGSEGPSDGARGNPFGRNYPLCLDVQRWDMTRVGPQDKRQEWNCGLPHDI